MGRERTILPATAKRVEEALRLSRGKQVDAAKFLGISKRALEKHIQNMRRGGYNVVNSPFSKIQYYQPNHASIVGTSTLVDVDGEVRLQWVKEKAGAAPPEEIAKAIKLALEEMPKRDPIPAPKKFKHSDLLCVYPMGDPHLGMYSWAEETGQDFDLQIAERTLVQATTSLVNLCPPAEQALIINVGDFFHADNKENRTMRSGAVLDVDTRWAKVLRVGLRTMRACIDAALTRHQTVRVINEIGNHDEHTSQVLTIALSMYYGHNPRVSFDESPARYHYFRFGKNLIGVTHGDAVKLEQLGPIMAVDRAAEWGQCDFRYWYTGHVHHKRVHEFVGFVAESFRTLAARDAWHAGEGYRSGRDMNAIVLHTDHGEVMRHRVDISLVEKLYK